MIYTGNARSAARAGDLSLRVAIVRSANGLPDSWFEGNNKASGVLKPGHAVCDVLSPNDKLFSWYAAQHKAGTWGPGGFRETYLPEFVSQMRYDARAKNVLNWLAGMDKAGENIELDCFCNDETTCHRSIIAGMLQGAGARVRTSSGFDFSRYWDMYKSAPMTDRVRDYLAERDARERGAGPGGRRVLGSGFDIPDGSAAGAELVL